MGSTVGTFFDFLSFPLLDSCRRDTALRDTAYEIQCHRCLLDTQKHFVWQHCESFGSMDKQLWLANSVAFLQRYASGASFFRFFLFLFLCLFVASSFLEVPWILVLGSTGGEKRLVNKGVPVCWCHFVGKCVCLSSVCVRYYVVKWVGNHDALISVGSSSDSLSLGIHFSGFLFVGLFCLLAWCQGRTIAVASMLLSVCGLGV